MERFRWGLLVAGVASTSCGGEAFRPSAATSSEGGATAGAGGDVATSDASSDGTDGAGGAEASVYARRVQSGLVALYDFENGSGSTVRDRSSSGSPLDLDIVETSAVAWRASALAILGKTLVRSETSAKKIVDRCKQSDAFTVEAWVQPANATQAGPARIVTISTTPLVAANVTLGQQADKFVVRLTTTDLGGRSEYELFGPNSVKSALTHVAATFSSSSGLARLYVDGSVAGSMNAIPGVLDSWNDTWRLGLANELSWPSDDRGWLGNMHLVAVYDRALSDQEIATNFAAGANP